MPMIRSITRLGAVGACALGLTALAAAAGVPALAATVDGPKVNWNFNMYGPKRAVTAGPEELARLVSEATGGNFNIQIHYAEILGPPREALDAISIGAYEITLVVSAFTPGKLPVVEGLGLPMLPTPTIHHGRAMREGFFTHPVPNADVARWKAKLITPMPIPSNEFVGKGKPPATLADWKGLRFRALGGDAKTVQLLGSTAQNFPPPEIYGAMERGLLDGTSSTLNSHGAFKIYEIGNWYTTNMAISSAPSIIIAGMGAINALPPQYQKLLYNSVEATNDYWLKTLLADDLKAIEAFKAKGLTPVTFSDADLARIRELVSPVWNEWVADMDKRGYPGKELLQLMIDSAKKAKVS
ncbi:MAG: TRAP transporter substrate-binding protein DctP [Alphaproteobacteria bacterium]